VCKSALVLVRHTQPDIEQGMCYGSLDLDVADSFKTESSAVISNLSTHGAFEPDVLVSSPLLRCQRLAKKISAAFELPVITDERIREMDFGTWEGIAWNDIDRAEIDEWTNDFYQARPHGGESVEMLVNRVKAAMGEYHQSGKNHLIVCHAGVIKAAMSTGTAASDFSTTTAFGEILMLPDNLKT